MSVYMAAKPTGDEMNEMVRSFPITLSDLVQVPVAPHSTFQVSTDSRDRPSSSRHAWEKLLKASAPIHPLVINTRYFPPTHTDTYHFQCDCACPDNGFVLQPNQDRPLAADPVLHHPALHGQQLSDSYTLLFNPLHDQGVSVLNPAAHDLWQQFSMPSRVSDVLMSLGDGSATHLINSLLDCGLLEVVGERCEPSHGPPQTLSAWLHVTNACNLRCDYCYINKSSDEMPAHVGRATVDAILRSAVNNGFRQVKLKFAGGEAMLNWRRVLEINTYARQRSLESGVGIEAVVLSNGVFVAEEIIELCRTQQMRISISLDGIGDFHDAQRRFVTGRGSFGWVDRTIEKLLARDVRPFLSITLTNRNAAGLAETVAYALERQLPFNINFFRDNDCAISHRDLRLQDERIIDAILNAFAVIEANLPEQSLLGHLIDRAQFDAPHTRTCSAGHSYLVIDQKGNIAKCQMEIEQPITNVYSGDPLAALRSAKEGVQNLPVEEKEGCRDCEWRYWCAGGCPIATYWATGRYDVKSPNCHIYKAIYPEALRLEGLRLLKMATLNGLLH